MLTHRKEKQTLRNVAVCGSQVRDLLPGNRSLAALEIEGFEVTAGLIDTPDPAFDPQAAETRSHVLVRVRGFSLNYRDLNFILAATRQGPANFFFALGSDLVGEVVEAGRDVTSLKVGDRVVCDNHYTGTAMSRLQEGVLTNQASKEYQVFRQDRLLKIPDGMPDEVAAAFSIGAQTTYAMLRRLELKPGAKVLVTAAKSNTSLFAVNALKGRGVEVYATSTSRKFEEELQALGVRELIIVDPDAENFLGNEQLHKLLPRIGLFDCVIDPFFDLHLHKVVDLMAPGGKYITCGLYEQFRRSKGAERTNPNLTKMMLPVLLKNLQIIGNCIGVTEDLRVALQDYERGAFGVLVDSVFTGDAVGDFLTRTYNAKDRFGKVVYLYDRKDKMR